MLHVSVPEREMDPSCQEVVGFCLTTLLVLVNLDKTASFESISRFIQRNLDA